MLLYIYLCTRHFEWSSHTPVWKLSSSHWRNCFQSNFYKSIWKLLAMVRMINPTPDTLEFCRLFPIVVEQLLMHVSKLPFIYHTKESYYEKPGKYTQFSNLPKLPKCISKALSEPEIRVLDDYRKSFLESVRQLNIRTQSTKDRPGTLPLYT